MLRRQIEGLFVVAFLLVAGALGAARIWPRPGNGFWWMVAEIAQAPKVAAVLDMTQLARRATPNDALVCPERMCQKARPDIIAPLFNVPVDELRRKVGIVAMAEPRTDELPCPTDTQCTNKGSFVQYSALFLFPDIIDVVVVGAGANSSTLAIYSRSVVGYGDLGVNRQRLERWLAALQRITPGA